MNVALPATGGDRVEVTVWTESNGLAIVVDWMEVSRPKDGDLYRVEIDDEDMPVSLKRKATYQATDQGIACGPVCEHASFGRTNVDCCPVSFMPDSAMYLGGSAVSGNTCGVTYDFWCTENFRIEPDANGCDQWRFDERDPRPGEDSLCWPVVDGGPPRDAGTD